MKRTLTIFTLVFTVMFSSTSFAEWTDVGKGVSGRVYYVDFERIRKHDGYVYYWVLQDNLKPDKWGDLSGTAYYQGDCKLFRYKRLSMTFHNENMGKGKRTEIKKKMDWEFPSPNSVVESMLKTICSRQ